MAEICNINGKASCSKLTFVRLNVRHTPVWGQGGDCDRVCTAIKGQPLLTATFLNSKIPPPRFVIAAYADCRPIILNLIINSRDIRLIQQLVLNYSSVLGRVT